MLRRIIVSLTLSLLLPDMGVAQMVLAEQNPDCQRLAEQRVVWRHGRGIAVRGDPDRFEPSQPWPEIEPGTGFFFDIENGPSFCVLANNATLLRTRDAFSETFFAPQNIGEVAIYGYTRTYQALADRLVERLPERCLEDSMACSASVFFRAARPSIFVRFEYPLVEWRDFWVLEVVLDEDDLVGIVAIRVIDGRTVYAADVEGLDR